MAKRHMIVDESGQKLRPAFTEEGRENQLIALSMDLVEKRLLNGTASSQETTHFLKLGSTKAKLELEKLKKENELLVAKTEALKSEKHSAELLQKAIEAFGIYTGKPPEDEEGEEDELVIF